ncbi:hypothetical protein SRB17_48730 [Streptomyces sp. RB17]|nr:hypothetical protein [Streptomyces sp. RB17]
MESPAQGLPGLTYLQPETCPAGLQPGSSGRSVTSAVNGSPADWLGPPLVARHRHRLPASTPPRPSAATPAAMTARRKSTAASGTCRGYQGPAAVRHGHPQPTGPTSSRQESPAETVSRPPAKPTGTFSRSWPSPWPAWTELRPDPQGSRPTRRGTARSGRAAGRHVRSAALKSASVPARSASLCRLSTRRPGSPHDLRGRVLQQTVPVRAPNAGRHRWAPGLRISSAGRATRLEGTGLRVPLGSHKGHDLRIPGRPAGR